MSSASSNDDTLVATVDLGSNSFHLLVARVKHGEMRPVVSHQENVQLAAGLKDGVLCAGALDRGLSCLRQFRQVLDAACPDILRVVGTNTLRVARNAQTFDDAAAQILGQRVEIISGREEARLIYLGVAHALADDQRARLVVDIGGGSTEFIIGERFESKLLESLYMGCISYREQFFPDGNISPRRFEKAYQKAYLEVLKIRNVFRRRGWSEAVGSAGTLNAIGKVLEAEQGLTHISRDGLELLKARVCGIGAVEGLKEISGLKSHRRSTFPAGLAISCALFDALDVGDMQVSWGGLREGMVYDLMGRMAHEDVRERTVAALMLRYDVDETAALRVEEFAGHLFKQAREDWALSAEDGELLGWAARLHEIGLAIAHSQFHKHGQYLIENSDLPGFSQTDQKILALLVRCHRRKFAAGMFQGLEGSERLHIQRLCILLRLAVLFKYVIPVEGAPRFGVSVGAHACTLKFSETWLQRHPLTMAALEEEQNYLRADGFELLLADG